MNKEQQFNHFSSVIEGQMQLRIEQDAEKIAALKSRIATLEKQLAEDKWVSVEERLPGMGETVIAYHEDWGTGAAFRTVNGFRFFQKYRSALCYSPQPTHWQPLPSPPQNK